MVTLILKNDFNREINIFWYYINNKDDLYHKKLIFNYFVDLEDKLRNIHDEVEAKNILRNYILSFRQINHDKIKKIEKLIEQQTIFVGNIIIDNLTNLMNYKFSDNHNGYIITPVILPFSPFKGNTFFYSLNKLLKSTDLDSLDLLIVLAHEMSHFLLFDKLKEQTFNNDCKMTDNELYFLKEILAVLIIRSRELVQWLKTEKYEGNMLLRFLYVKENNNIKLISDYFNELYTKHIENGLNFDLFLIDMIKKIKYISSELNEKIKIWNQYGAEREKYIDQIIKYKYPIEIK